MRTNQNSASCHVTTCSPLIGWSSGVPDLLPTGAGVLRHHLHCLPRHQVSTISTISTIHIFNVYNIYIISQPRPVRDADQQSRHHHHRGELQDNLCWHTSGRKHSSGKLDDLRWTVSVATHCLPRIFSGSFGSCPFAGKYFLHTI